MLAWILLLVLGTTDVATGRHGKCRGLSHIKGLTFSLFATIRALHQLKQDAVYDVDYTLAYGTLLAFERNALIFPWDSDADIYLIFGNNLNDTELLHFTFRLKQAIDTVMGPGNNAVVDWHNAAEGRYVGVHAVDGLTGWLDAFVLFWGDDTHRQLRGYHCSTQPFNWPWGASASLIFPIRYNQTWPVYNFAVNIPNKHQRLMAHEYGYLYRTPNVENWRLQCRNVNSSALQQWMQVLQTDVSHIDDVQLNQWMHDIDPTGQAFNVFVRRLLEPKWIIILTVTIAMFARCVTSKKFKEFKKMHAHKFRM